MVREHFLWLIARGISECTNLPGSTVGLHWILGVAYSDISCFTERVLHSSLYLIQLMHSIMHYKNSLLPKPKFLCRYIFTFHLWKLHCYRTNKNQFESMSSKKSPYFSLLAILARKEKKHSRGERVELEFQVSGLSLHTTTLAHFKLSGDILWLFEGADFQCLPLFKVKLHIKKNLWKNPKVFPNFSS